VFTVGKPSANSLGQILFSGGYAIPAGASVCPPRGTLDFLGGGIVVTYAGAAPSIGAQVGTATGTWTVTSGQTGLIVLGVDSARSLCFVRPFSAAGGTFSACAGKAVRSDGNPVTGPTTVRTSVAYSQEVFFNLAQPIGGTDKTILLTPGIMSAVGATTTHALRAYKLTAAVDFDTLTWAGRPTGTDYDIVLDYTPVTQINTSGNESARAVRVNTSSDVVYALRFVIPDTGYTAALYIGKNDDGAAVIYQANFTEP
jgi:hypothetical protein